MNPPANTVVVFGATSYLGYHLLSRLAEQGSRVYAVTRNPAVGDILLHPFREKITVCAPSDIRCDQADAVVNLAYVKQPIPVGILRRNRDLVESVHQAAVRVRSRRLVHVSSAAVFGYGPDVPPVPGPAPRIRGDSYVELKAAAERHVVAAARGSSYVPIVVRPGNILGPASPVWVAAPAQRMLEGRPVAVAGQDGLANATYAPNLADYLAHLIATPVDELTAFGVFHHIAEFSAVRWSVLFRAFAAAIGVQPVYVGDPNPPAPPALALLASRALQAYRGNLGVWVRRALGHVSAPGLGDRMYLNLKTQLAGRSLVLDKHLVAGDRNYLSIVSATREFRTHALAGWRPKVSLEDAIVEIQAALRADGFALEHAPAPGR